MTGSIKLGDVISFREFTYRNAAGGTEFVGAFADKKICFTGKVLAIVPDSEAGDHIHCLSDGLSRYILQDRQNADDKRIIVSAFNVLHTSPDKRRNRKA